MSSSPPFLINPPPQFIQSGKRRRKIQEEEMMRSHQHPFHHQDHDHHSRLLHDLSALVLNLLRSPIPFHDDPSSPDLVTRRSSSSSITPAGFVSLMLGMSLALMLCGSVTFFIGFMLMPWVLGLVVLLYVAGIVSALSFLGRSIICFATGPPSPKKEIPSWKLL